MGFATHQAVTDESVTPCPSCREALKREAATYGPSSRRSRLLCFDCCRADLERARAFKAAGELDTASEARFQSQLPFEPVNRSRLEMLKAERSESRAAARRGISQYVDKQHHAQIEARHALQANAGSLKDRELAPAAQVQAIPSVIHAELQLHDVLLPFAASR